MSAFADWKDLRDRKVLQGDEGHEALKDRPDRKEVQQMVLF